MSTSPFDPGLTLNTAPHGVLGASAPALPTVPAQAPLSPFSAALTVSGAPQIAPQSAGQLARTMWAKTPGWQRPLMFVGQGLNAVGTGIDHLIGVHPSGVLPQANFGPYAAPQPHQPAPGVNAALDAQHPAYNYLVKWPAEFAASLPLGESAGALAGRGMEALGLTAPETAPLWQRALAAAPQSAAVGAAYGVQQPQGSPGANAAIGAVAGPLLEGGMRGVGALASKGGPAPL